MKQILKILTTFLAAIGLWAALLVGFIVIYSQVIGRFRPTQSVTPETEAPLITNITSPEVQSLLNEDSYLSFSEESLPDVESQDVASAIDIDQEPYTDTQPVTEYQVPSDTMTTSIVSTENINPSTNFTESSPPSAGTQNQSLNNFDTYDNPDQQQTDDNYVLNTSTMKVHYPNCNYVKKIAPENYSSSSLSLDELKAQGYSTCGHCF